MCRNGSVISVSNNGCGCGCGCNNIESRQILVALNQFPREFCSDFVRSAVAFSDSCGGGCSKGNVGRTSAGYSCSCCGGCGCSLCCDNGCGCGCNSIGTQGCGCSANWYSYCG